MWKENIKNRKRNSENLGHYLGHYVPENVSDNVLEKESGKLTDTERRILWLVNSGISENKRISDETGLTTRTVGRTLKKLSEKGLVTRIGFDRKGYWVVLRK